MQNFVGMTGFVSELKHSKKVDEPKHEESALIIDAVETISISVVDEENLVDNEEIDELNVNEKTFNNPSQTDNKFSEQTFKCETCDFKAERKYEVNNHTKNVQKLKLQCVKSMVCQHFFLFEHFLISRI